MYTPEILLDIHDRAHRCLQSVLDHCRGFEPAELHREMPGFGYASLHAQLHHVLGGERYWVGVLAGRIDIQEDGPDFPTVAALGELRQAVFATTAAYLGQVTVAELNEARPMMTWRQEEQMFVPAHIIMRTQTHIFHHQGQITAMCRLLERPLNGVDYPLD